MAQLPAGPEVVESINLLHARISQLEALAPAPSWKFWKGASNEEIDFMNKLEERMKALEDIQGLFNAPWISKCKDDIVLILALHKNLEARVTAIERNLNFRPAKPPQPPDDVVPSAPPPPPPPPPPYQPPPPPPPYQPPTPEVPSPPSAPEYPQGTPSAAGKLGAIQARFSAFAREAERIGR